MSLLRRAPFALVLPLALAACASDTRPGQELCPNGTVRVEGQCVRPDASTDAGTTPDASDGDASQVDATEADGSAEDATPAADATALDAAPGDGPLVDAGIDAGVLDAAPADATALDASPADAGTAAATLSATSLDFGRVVVGASATMTLVLSNPTSAVVFVRPGLVSGAGAADFAVTASSTVTASGIELQPSTSAVFTFTFAPRATGPRPASLQVWLCDGGCEARVTLAGEGILETIACAPPTIDFGAVSPGSCLVAPVSCTNVSDDPAAILGWSIAHGSSADFTLSPSAALPITLLPTETASVGVTFCPAGVGAATGALEIDTDNPNPAHARSSVTLAGEGGGPDLHCAPSTLEFGIVAVNQTRSRTLTCTNSGNAELMIASVTQSAGASLTLTTGFPNSVAAGGSFDLILEYAPHAPGTLAGTLTISTEDLDTPTIDVPIHGQAVDGSGCALTLEPTGVAFGAVRVNRTMTATLLAHNTGTGACLLASPAITPSGAFALSAPFASTTVAPNGALPIELTFTPPREQAFAANLTFQTSDPTLATATVGLTGTGVGLQFPVVVEPAAVDFGTLVGGCPTPGDRPVTVRNLGANPLSLTVSIDAGTPAAFTIDPPAPANLNLAPGQAGTVHARFAPPANGSYAGRLRVSAPNTPDVFVPLTGVGATSATNVVTFAGNAAQVVDVLLMIDDSGSMAEEQARLQVAAGVMLARGDASGVDYHIAVTTTDPGPLPVPGSLRGIPPYVTSTSAARLGELQANIVVGTNGSGTEEGLFTSAEAVTSPALLGGPSAGFLRSDGELVVIAISDEEDQSPGTVESYLAAMDNRPIGMPGVRFYAITGGALGCTGGGGSADVEHRYTQAASATGGFVGSICDADYTNILTRIADATFHAGRGTFQLGSRPAPDTVSVRVDGVATPSAGSSGVVWGVDYVNARVVFLPGHMPAASSTVEITYDAMCTAGSCGNGHVNPHEQCDDGNAVDTDGCLSTCYTASCGDGFVRANGEQCDDGNTIPGDGCNEHCIVEGCGNGMLEPGEACDDGAANSDTTPNACRTDCQRPYCHDGVVDTGEQCDDGNTTDTDGCVGTCALAACGDGFVQAGVEQCDDGNRVDNDACSNACRYTTASFHVTVTPNVPLAPPAAGTALAFAPTSDDGSAAVPIPFAFRFLGLAVSTVYVSTNGYVTFEAAAPTAFQNVAIPNVADPNAFIAWWWDDLQFLRPSTTPASIARWWVTGTAPNRALVFGFANVPMYGGGGTLLNAEVALHETTNTIDVHYGQLGSAGGSATAFSATVGWESSGGILGQDPLGCSPSCTAASWPADTLITYAP